MSEQVECEVCGAKAWRRTSRWAPEGWLCGFYRMTTRGETFVAMVCSDSCARAFWKPWDWERINDSPPEPRPTGAHLRARLYSLLESFSLQRILAALGRVVQERHRAGGNVCVAFNYPERRHTFELVEAPGDLCRNTGRLPSGAPCPGCRACC